MTTDKERELAGKLCELFPDYEMDTIIPVLVTFLATAGVSACSDKDVFLGYVNNMIDNAYAEVDHSDEPIQ
jgi:hypothetical protein